MMSTFPPVSVIGQPVAVRAMTVALTGNHSILLWGPRGVGKDTIRRAFPHDAYIRNVMDSCPCGNYSSIVKECTCNEVQLRRWSNRFHREVAHHDINVEVPPVTAKEMLNSQPWVFDEVVAKRVAAARAFGQTHTSAVRDEMGNRLMEMAVRRMSLTVGQLAAAVRVARTIANLNGSPLLQAKHLAEAVQYQTLGRMMDRRDK